MDKMIFEIDKRIVVEGDVVTVTWNCAGADRVELTLDNGYKATVIPLELSGTKRFRLNRSKGKTSLTITAHVNGKPYKKTIKVKVTEMPTMRAETVDEKGRHMGNMENWWRQRVLPKWQAAKSRRRAAFASMPPNKRLAVRILLLLALILLLARIFPILFFLGLIGIVVYLVWVILKR